MTRKYYNKLIRDNIPQVIAKRNAKAEISVLNKDKFLVAIKDKLIEESKEVLKANDKADVINELADVMQLVDSIAGEYKISSEELSEYKSKKAKDVGLFNKKLFLKYVDEQEEESKAVEKECVFCKFSKDSNVKVWENDLFFAMFDSYPVGVGHTLVIPKRHVLSLSELKETEWKELKEVNSDILKLIKNTNFKKIYSEMLKNPISLKSAEFLESAIDYSWINSQPDAFNYGVNDGREAGRTVDHLHWHIIPRYKGDMEDPTGGVRYVIPEKGNYKK